MVNPRQKILNNMPLQTACRLTVADGVGEVFDVVGSRHRGVVVADDGVELMREAGDRRQHVAVQPRLSGHREERDSGSSSFGRRLQRHGATVGVAVRQHDSDERNISSPLAVQQNYSSRFLSGQLENYRAFLRPAMRSPMHFHCVSLTRKLNYR